MPGLKGITRTPTETQRARRNATALASEFDTILGDGLVISGGGIISVDIVTSGGLKFTSAELEVDEPNVDHDLLGNFVANEHIDWTGATEDFLTTGSMSTGQKLTFRTRDRNGGTLNDSLMYMYNSQTGTADSDGLVIEILDLDGFIWNLENSFLSFGTNTAERMVISAAGDFDFKAGDMTTTGTGHFTTLSVDDVTLTPTSDTRFYVRDRYPTILTGSVASALILRQNDQNVSSSGAKRALYCSAQADPRSGTSQTTYESIFCFSFLTSTATQNVVSPGKVVALAGWAGNANATKLVSNAWGLSFYIANEAGGTIDNGRAINIVSALNPTGTITANTGIWVNDQTVGNTNYGIVIDSDTIGLTLGDGQDVTIYWDGSATNFGASPITTTGTLTAGASTFGDGGTTDYAQFEADGTLEFKGAAIVWDDLRVSVNSVKVPATKAPAWTAFSAGLLLGFSYQSVEANEEEVYFVVQIPHGRKLGSDIIPHIHWVPNEDTTDDPEVVRWGLEYEWVDTGNNFSATTTIYAEESFTDTANKHTYTTFAAIDGSGHTALFTMLVCRLFRNSSHANDTYDSGTALALLLEVDFHIEINTIGSRQESTK